jgi:hypothetical protein
VLFNRTFDTHQTTLRSARRSRICTRFGTRAS